MMLAGRFFAGMGIGFLGVLAPCGFPERLVVITLTLQCINLKSVCPMFEIAATILTRSSPL